MTATGTGAGELRTFDFDSIAERLCAEGWERYPESHDYAHLEKDGRHIRWWPLSGPGHIWLGGLFTVDEVLSVLTPAGGLTEEQVESLAECVRDAAYYVDRTAHAPEDHRRITVARSAIKTLRPLVERSTD